LFTIQPTKKKTGDNADNVIGAANLTVAGDKDCSANSLFYPEGVWYDESTNSLFVSDTFHNRIMVFSDVIPPMNYPNATLLLGQSTFINCPSLRITNSASFYSPTGLMFDSTTLWVTDQQNNRILHIGCNSEDY